MILTQKKINFCEAVRRSPENNIVLQVKCTYCGKWYTPKISDIRKRTDSILGKGTGENRLYCSEECKSLCPIFRKIKYSDEEQNKNKESREVQPELRQLVFARDNWHCTKCNSAILLQCHHKEGILWEPIQSADIDMCLTLCKKCHKEAHQKEGCSYTDMKCDKGMT